MNPYLLPLSIPPLPSHTHPLSSKDINSQVTVTTKTFMRYRELKLLINSLRRFYKDIILIVADDSFQKENLTEDNVLQYMMPGGQVGIYYLLLIKVASHYCSRRGTSGGKGNTLKIINEHDK